ncbi:hypothetical protein DAEQUDRAFT_586077 [Daedalea quercina L-15889]|uniref:F-box domain-containing protein n=1 Tax=Daedalea quercina L-15889 TaxID=1314783 RepID=A0A165LR01_9APHY|nr:hypothetical protein DAEQUDRAFT_586077 [Daedalea quercina L-15889]
MKIGVSRTGNIPPEIWQMVLGSLPRHAARECLFVSKLFHDLAARLLFSTLRIRLGSWQVRLGYADEPPEEDSGHTSCELLLGVITNPVFASYVKYLQILASAGNDATFELCCLARAVRCLHNLHELEWQTSFSDMLPTSEFIGIQTLTLAESQGLGQLPITRISVYPSWDDTPEEYTRHRAALASLLSSFRGSLTQFAAPSQAIWECPIRILRDLTHLVVDMAKNLMNIALLFHHCTRLESLHIAAEDYEDSTEWFALLGENAAGLPNLTHFKLHGPHPTITALKQLARFVGSKKKLRCLDYSDLSSGVPDLWPLISVLRSLPALEILGLDLLYESLTSEAFLDLKRAIPQSVTALRLYIEYDFMELPDACSLWADLPKLAFAHIRDELTLPIIDMHDVAVAAKSLKLIGNRSDFHEVNRTGDEVKLGRPWSDTKVQFRTSADFGCEDWDWLMAGHTLFHELSYLLM